MGQRVRIGCTSAATMLLACAALGAFTSAAQARVDGCRSFQHRYSNGNVRYYEIRVYRVGCASARSLMLKWSTSGGKVKVKGYSCAYHRTSTKVYALAVSCTSGKKWVRFRTLTTRP